MGRKRESNRQAETEKRLAEADRQADRQTDKGILTKDKKWKS